MEIYGQDDLNTNSLDSATKAIARAAGRLALSIVRSIQYLKPAAVEHLESLLSPASLWVLAIILAGWVIATVVGGPIALVINGLLGAYGLYQLYEQLAITWQNLRDWAVTAYRATNDSELDKASRSFAQAVTDGGLAFIEVLITHRIFKSVEGNLRKRYPAPDWLKSEFDKAMEARKTKARPAEPEGKAKTAPDDPQARRESPANEEAERLRERRRAFDGERVPLPPPPLPPGGDSAIPIVAGVVSAAAFVAGVSYLATRSK
jgi:hypothetical protein